MRCFKQCYMLVYEGKKASLGLQELVAADSFIQELKVDVSVEDQISNAEKIVKLLEAKIKHDKKILSGLVMTKEKKAELAAEEAKLAALKKKVAELKKEDAALD